VVSALVVETSEARHVPIDAPIWIDVWKIAPPTDCSSLTISLSHCHYLIQWRKTYCSTRFDIMTFPRQTILLFSFDRNKAAQLTSRYPMGSTSRRWIGMPSKMCLLVQRQRAGMQCYFISILTFQYCSAHLPREHPIKIKTGALTLGPSHMTLPYSLALPSRAGKTYSSNSPSNHTR